MEHICDYWLFLLKGHPVSPETKNCRAQICKTRQKRDTPYIILESNYLDLCFIPLMAEILRQLRLVVYPIICRVFYIPRGAGFLPSTVVSFLYFVFSETAPLMPSIPAGCELCIAYGLTSRGLAEQLRCSPSEVRQKCWEVGGWISPKLDEFDCWDILEIRFFMKSDWCSEDIIPANSEECWCWERQC